MKVIIGIHERAQSPVHQAAIHNGKGRGFTLSMEVSRPLEETQ
jgi:hypothetical protein